MVDVYFSSDYTSAYYASDTTRKSSWIANSLRGLPVFGLNLKDHDPLDKNLLINVHDKVYVNAVQTGFPIELAQSQGFHWSPSLWNMVLSSNNGIVKASLNALENGVSGSLSSGLHHAKYNKGAGFCTFNGLVIAAKQARIAGAQNILILDLDAHCGGGTAALIKDDPNIWMIDISVNEYDWYLSNNQIVLIIVKDSKSYLGTIENQLNEIIQKNNSFDLCIYNAGMDPHENCPIGGLAGINYEILKIREELVFNWCSKNKIPLAFAIAGGYLGPQMDMFKIINLHRITLSQSAKYRIGFFS